MDISKFLVKIFGDKKSRDLKAYKPMVEEVLKVYPEIQALSNDELRARSKAIRQRIQDTVTELRQQIQTLKDKIPSTDIQDRAPIFAQIDKLEKDVLETFEKALDKERAEVFAIVKSTAERFAKNETVEVTANDFDRDLAKLSKADFRELKEVNGVGTYTACKIMAALELGRRRQTAMMGLSPDLSSATAIYNYMLPKMRDLIVEESHVLLMNQNFKLIKCVRLSQGGLTEVSVDIRVLMKEAVVNNATVIAFCHNHPSGNAHPSAVDDRLTQSLQKACECIRLHFLDHVIVCDNKTNRMVEYSAILFLKIGGCVKMKKGVCVICPPCLVMNWILTVSEMYSQRKVST